MNAPCHTHSPYAVDTIRVTNSRSYVHTANARTSILRQYEMTHPTRRVHYSVVQCVAVCCSVLQCVAVRYSALQCVAVHCRALQCVAVHCSALQCIAVRFSALQCIAVRCSALQCVAVRCSASRCAGISILQKHETTHPTR